MSHSREGGDSSSQFTSNDEETLEQSCQDLELEQYRFRLYVAGNSPKSLRAIQNLKKICDEHLPGHYEIEVIDIYQRPELLEQEQIFAIPTLIKKLPLPLQRLIGDMTNTEDVISYLGL
ncbi:MAG TPA: circadian clock KaiB family protein [Stenomitos sp.]